MQNDDREKKRGHTEVWNQTLRSKRKTNKYDGFSETKMGNFNFKQ